MPELRSLSYIAVSRETIRRLTPGNLLNDDLIQAYSFLLQGRKPRAGAPRCLFFPPQFLVKLVGATSGEGYAMYDYAKVKRWTKRSKDLHLFDGDGQLRYDILLFPRNLPMHWTLAWVDFRERCICYYDSLSADDVHTLEVLRRWLHDEWLDKRRASFDDTGWTVKNLTLGRVPRQRNNGRTSMDCVVSLSAGRCP